MGLRNLKKDVRLQHLQFLVMHACSYSLEILRSMCATSSRIHSARSAYLSAYLTAAPDRLETTAPDRGAPGNKRKVNGGRCGKVTADQVAAACCSITPTASCHLAPTITGALCNGNPTRRARCRQEVYLLV